MMTTEEVAAYLKLHEKTVRRLYVSGSLVGARMGDGKTSPLRFRKVDVDAFVQRQIGK